MLKYGKKVAPLQLIGTFMSYAGNAMLNDIWTRYQRKIFFGGYKAVKMSQLGSGQDTLWITEAQHVTSG